MTCIERFEADKVAILDVWNSGDRVDIKYGTVREAPKDEFRLIRVFAYCTIPQLLSCINFRFNNYCIHNYDNACIQYEHGWW